MLENTFRNNVFPMKHVIYLPSSLDKIDGSEHLLVLLLSLHYDKHFMTCADIHNVLKMFIFLTIQALHY